MVAVRKDRNMPLLTELENIWGCDATKISPRTGLDAVRRERRDAAAAGVVFS
jgi:hypothetical protein